jgi:crotonobetaine/carnitine-CoA ligase
MKLYDIARYEDRTLGQVLAAQARDLPDDIWLMSDDRKVSFSEADKLANRYANGLARHGVAKGDTVAMVMEPSIEVPLLAMAAARLGAIFSPLNTDYHGAFLQDAIQETHAPVLVIDPGFVERLAELSDLGSVKHVFVNGERRGDMAALSELLDADDSAPAVEVGWRDPVQLTWSSGTTGKSKGVLHSHSSVLFSNHSTAKHLVDDDVLYSCTPVYLGSAWVAAIWPALIAGLPAAIDARFSVSEFWNRVRLYKATSFLTLGAMHMFLWKQPPSENDGDVRIRRARCIPMDQDLIPKFKERFNIEEMPQVYGTNETFSIFDAPEDGTEWTGNAAGRPVLHYEVRLMDENDMPVPVGEVGEICVRPREPGILFLGYFNAPERTLEAWRECWHHTGDLAYCDEDGVYYFADRKKDYIRFKGRNISMFEVENVADTHDAVAEAAAFGIPSKELESESELMLSLVLKPGATLTAEEIARYINDKAPYYFVPRYIEFVDELPRNAHKRVLKDKLRERGLSGNPWDMETSDFEVKR